MEIVWRKKRVNFQWNSGPRQTERNVERTWRHSVASTHPLDVAKNDLGNDIWVIDTILYVMYIVYEADIAREIINWENVWTVWCGKYIWTWSNRDRFRNFERKKKKEILVTMMTQQSVAAVLHYLLSVFQCLGHKIAANWQKIKVKHGQISTKPGHDVINGLSLHGWVYKEGLETSNTL